MAELSDSEKAVQLISPGFKVGLDDPDEAQALVELGVGGFCLYAGDVESVSSLTSRLQARALRPLLFNADYEDGLPQHCAGGTPLPSNMGVGASDSEDAAFEKGDITGAEARALGVHWVFAPVLDLATNPKNPIVNTRAFSDEPERVARLGRAYLRGLKKHKVLGCLKHFPGHGETFGDSHLELLSVSTPRELLEKRELSPFAALADEAGAIMTAHVQVPALEPDPKLPYSISSDVARTIRGRMKFEGLVSTDALNMRAIANNFDELDAAKRALLGGADILLVPANARELARALPEAVAADPALASAVRAAFARLEKARADAGLTDSGSAMPASDLSFVGGRAHMERAERLAEKCLAWAGPCGAELRAPALAGPLRYWEPDADRPDEWLGAAFVDALRALGFEVRPHDPKAPAPDETLVAATFLAPHAYSGFIEYEESDAARISKELKARRKSVLVSFGSPFVFKALGASGLCAFSRWETSQRAAALALAGRLEVKGRMPVKTS